MSFRLNILFFLTLTLLWSGCSGDEPMLPESPEAETGRGTYLRLILNPTTRSRANPTGGEIGDDPRLDRGRPNERKIDNLTVFFYNSPAGVDAPDNTPIRHAVYINSGLTPNADGSIVKVIKLVNFLPEATDRILVAANCGDLTHLATMGQVRNHELKERWHAGARISEYSAFTMASAMADDGYLTFADDEGELDGSFERPFGAEVTVERTAARIDLKFKDTLGEYGAATDKVYIDNIMVVNDTQAPSWLMKRVTESTDDFTSVRYGGDELIDTRERPLNYVMEPRTLLKSAATPAATLGEWYGASTAANVQANYATLFNSTNALSGREVFDEDYKYVTLAYTNENTQPQEMHLEQFATGLALKATYVPNGFTKGKTFWRYTPAGDREGKNVAKFFDNEAEANAYKEEHAEENGTVTKFADGVCYYHTWIRHANVEDPTTGNHECAPMEYAIVRNNIYILSFTFSGPGTPKPEFEDPETVKLHVYVRKWNVRNQSTIIM